MLFDLIELAEGVQSAYHHLAWQPNAAQKALMHSAGFSQTNASTFQGTYYGLNALVTLSHEEDEMGGSQRITQLLLQRPNPLRLGLRFETAPRHFGLFSSGPRPFHREFNWSSRERDKLQQMLSYPDFRTRVEYVQSRVGRIYVDDYCVRIVVPLHFMTVDILRSNLDLAKMLIDDFGRARQLVGPTQDETAIIHAWQQSAERLSLPFDPMALHAQQDLREGSLSLWLYPGKKSAWVTAARLTFAQSLEAGLALGLEGTTIASKLKLSRDIEVGDAPFDKAFLIRAGDASLAQTVLESARLREALLELRPSADHFMLTDHTFEVAYPEAITDPARIDALVKSLRVVLKELVNPKAQSVGAFR